MASAHNGRVRRASADRSVRTANPLPSLISERTPHSQCSGNEMNSSVSPSSPSSSPDRAISPKPRPWPACPTMPSSFGSPSASVKPWAIRFRPWVFSYSPPRSWSSPIRTWWLCRHRLRPRRARSPSPAGRSHRPVRPRNPVRPRTALRPRERRRSLGRWHQDRRGPEPLRQSSELQPPRGDERILGRRRNGRVDPRLCRRFRSRRCRLDGFPGRSGR